MRHLDLIEVKTVAGASVIIAVGEAIAIGGGVFSTPGIITGQTTQEFGASAGAYIGEGLFNTLNPNPLGQTVYYADQFGESYIAPLPDWYIEGS